MTSNETNRAEADSTQTQNGVLAAFTKRLSSLLVVATVILTAASAATLLARRHWLADICANLRMQWAIGLLLVGLLCVLLGKWKLLSVTMLLLAFHSPWFVTAFLSRGAVSGTPFITVATANVLSRNQRHDEIESQLLNSNADIVAILELSTPLRDHLQGEFAKRYPHSRELPDDLGNFGIGLYSRIPFESAKIDYFNDERISSIVAQLASDGRDVIVIATHTLPPMGPGSFAHRNRHLQLLADRVRKLRQAEPDVPVVVVGDLNLTPWSPVFSEFLAQAELTTSRGGLGVTPTWYRFPLFPFGLVLDHVLTTPDLSTVSYDVGDDMGSDHRMVTASFRFAGDSQRRDVAKRNGNR